MRTLSTSTASVFIVAFADLSDVYRNGKTYRQSFVMNEFSSVQQAVGRSYEPSKYDLVSILVNELHVSRAP